MLGLDIARDSQKCTRPLTQVVFDFYLNVLVGS